MHKIDADGAVDTMPTFEGVGTTVGFFGPGDPQQGKHATRVHHDWLNTVQQEVVNVIEGMGITLDKTKTDQLLDALKILTGKDAPATVQTTDATVTDLATVSVAEGDVVSVEVSVIGRKSDGTDRLMSVLKGLFYRNTSGDVTQEGGTHVVVENQSDGDWNVELAADTSNQTVDIRVTGKAATTINWKGSVKVLKVT